MAVNPSILAKLFGPQPQGGVDLGAMGMSMLANSQTHRGQAPSFGSILGKGMLAGREANSQNVQAQQLQELRQQRIDQNDAKTQRMENLKRMIGGGANYEGQGFATQADAQAAPSAVSNLSPQARAVLQSLSPEMQEQVLYQQSGLAPQVETLTADQAQQMGLPGGSLVQRDPTTGQIRILREGFDANAMQQELGMRFGYDQRLMQQKAALAASQPRDLDVRDRKAMNLMGQNIPQAMAYNIVDGIVDYEINEKTGRVVYTNKATGEVKEVPLANPAEPTPYEGPTIWGLNEKDAITGADNTIARGVNVVSGLFGSDAGGPSVQGAQFVDTARQNMLRALANNPRYPVAEMERLREEVNIGADVLGSQQQLRNKMVAVNTALEQRLRNEQRVSNDPNQPVEQREAASQAATDIRNFLEQMGVPEDANMSPVAPSTVPGQQGAPAASGQGPLTIEINRPRGGEAPPAPEGVDAADWEYMTPEERALWQ